MPNADMVRLHSETSDDQESSPSSSAQTVAWIDDLLLQILSRLRLKPLFRFKSISKHWNSLISDLKLRPNPAAVGLIFYPAISRRFFACIVPFEEPDGPTYLPVPENVEIEIMHGCNGLLVYSATENETFNTQYFVLNPTTMQRKMLPKPMCRLNCEILAMCLAFDPSNSPGYKVVCVSGYIFDREVYWYDRFQVYSSETGSWRYASMQPFIGLLDVKNGVYWNGALHWISIRSSYDSIYFDPDGKDHQMPRVFPSPPTLMYQNNSEYGDYFGESCGHLHFVGAEMDWELRVYEMKRDYSEWFVKYRIHHSICGLIHGRYYRYLLIRGRVNSHIICGFFRGEKEEDCFLVLWDERRIIRQNIVSGAFETLHELPYSCLGFPLPYIESICSV